MYATLIIFFLYAFKNGCETKDLFYDSFKLDFKKDSPSIQNKTDGYKNFNPKLTDSLCDVVVPKPLSQECFDEVYEICYPEIIFKVNFENVVLDRGIQRFVQNSIRKPTNNVCSEENSFFVFNIVIETTDLNLSIQSNQSYLINVSYPVSQIKANNVWGALYALETISQLIYTSEEGKLFIIKTNIVDEPRMKYRGFLIDTSRHYLSVDTILKHLDTMSYSKLNVLHWHIVDDNSFPYVSFKYPELHRGGSFIPKYIYKRQDIRKILNEAYLRGINVIPEFDTPDHTYSWRGKKDFLTECNRSSTQDTTDSVSYRTANPILNSTYEFLRALFVEVHNLFDNEIFHLGGDELNYDHWKCNQDIGKFMEDNGFGKDYRKLASYYFDRVCEHPIHMFSEKIVWDDFLDYYNGSVCKNVIVEVWRNQRDCIAAASKGFRVILAAGWYINNQLYNGNSWKEMYLNDPFKEFPDTLKDKIFGGSLCLWGERVSNSNFFEFSWAIGFSAAERMWSSELVTDLKNAEERFNRFTCILISRGIHANPVTPNHRCI